jgi:hypothetical protein
VQSLVSFVYTTKQRSNLLVLSRSELGSSGRSFWLAAKLEGSFVGGDARFNIEKAFCLAVGLFNLFPVAHLK